MRRNRFRRNTGAAAIVLLASAGLAGAPTPASASHTPACNIVVGAAGFTLTHDIGPCPGDGLRVESDNAVINLNGFSIIGDGSTTVTTSGYTGLYGDAGIRIEGVSNVTVTNSITTGGNAGRDCTTGATGWGTGQISGFDVGIAIAGVDLVGGTLTLGTGGHTVEKVTVRDNISTPLSDYGDGIHILNSSNNTVVDNRVLHNGSLSGVQVDESGAPENTTGGLSQTGPGTSDNNIIGRTGAGAQAERSPCDGGNVISDNDIEGDLGLPTPTCGSASTPAGGSNQDDGVRLEPGVTNNKVENNTIERNGLDGVAIFFAPAYSGVGPIPPDNNFTSGNLVKGNLIRDNGFHEWVGTATSSDPYPRANCTAAQANSPSPDPGPGWAQKTHRKGDGIRVFGPNSLNNATANTIEGNKVCGNAASGIRVDGGLKATDPATLTGNRNSIQGNKSGSAPAPEVCDSNNQQAPASANFDMFDSNKTANIAAGRPACNSNNWGNLAVNTFGTENPPACIL